MKTSIRAKFIMGVVFFLVIILLLSVLSAYYLNVLSVKTSAILTENHYSVIYARDMSEDLTNINQEITNFILTKKEPDSSFINKQLKLFVKSLQLEKNNITESGEDKLATAIETDFMEYRDSIEKINPSVNEVDKVIFLQTKFISLYRKLLLLSQMNEEAINVKTTDTKAYSKKSSIQMTIVSSICFLIAFGFTFSFGSYFNERFMQLYHGIKEIRSSDYEQRLYFEGKDEFNEISLVFNEMAEKINRTKLNNPSAVDTELELGQKIKNIDELKRVIANMKRVEEQALDLIERLEKKE